jgi:hypothetical protein
MSPSRTRTRQSTTLHLFSCGRPPKREKNLFINKNLPQPTGEAPLLHYHAQKGTLLVEEKIARFYDKRYMVVIDPMVDGGWRKVMVFFLIFRSLEYILLKFLNNHHNSMFNTGSLIGYNQNLN